MSVALGCQTQTRQVVAPAPVDPCPLPTGYILAKAIEKAEQSLLTCPEKLDAVFFALLDIAKHKPEPDNRIMIRDLLMRLSKRNLFSERYAKELYNKYFDVKFHTLPDVKTYNLSGEIDSIKKELKKELTFKKIGLIECSGDKKGYKKTEDEYARLINFLENLVYNEQYLKTTKGSS